MRLLMSTGALWRFPLSETLSVARDVGVDGLELTLDRAGDFSVEAQEDFVRQARQDGLIVPTAHAPLQLNDETVARTLDIARRLDLFGMVVHPGPLEERLTLFSGLKELSVEVLVENMLVSREPADEYYPPSGYHGGDDLVDELRARGVFLVLDLHHVIVNGDDPVEAAGVLCPVTRHVHISGDSHAELPPDAYSDALGTLAQQVRWVTVEMAEAVDLGDFVARTRTFIDGVRECLAQRGLLF